MAIPTNRYYTGVISILQTLDIDSIKKLEINKNGSGKILYTKKRFENCYKIIKNDNGLYSLEFIYRSHGFVG